MHVRSWFDAVLTPATWLAKPEQRMESQKAKDVARERPLLSAPELSNIAHFVSRMKSSQRESRFETGSIFYFLGPLSVFATIFFTTKNASLMTP